MLTQDHWSMIDRLLDLALEEDVGPGDVTTNTIIPEAATVTGHFVARQSGVLAGMEVVKRLWSKMDDRVEVQSIEQEGKHFHPGNKLARIAGPARSILTGERLALNILQRMSGVASITRTYAETVSHTRAKICDTRKTMPGMRALDKLAVYIGGGHNHRRGLYDMILIKDNHLHLTGPTCPEGSVACAINHAREHSDLPIMVEVDTLDQLKEALEVEPDYVLLDNMDVEMLKEAVRLTNTLSGQLNKRRPLLEASGGVTLQTVRLIAETGVDRISVGALTHSAPSLDIALDFGLDG